MKVAKRRVVGVAVGVFACVLVAGCGGGPSPGGGGAPELRVINLGQYAASTLGPDAGAYLDTFKDAGLTVETTYGQDAVAALAAGSVDFAVTSPNRIVGAIQKGLEATIIGPTVTAFVQYIIVGKKSGITSLADFKGGNIGISQFGSAGHYSALKVAQKLGWKKEDYKLVPLSDLDGLSAALESGTIDAFMWSAEASFGIEEEGTGTILGNVADMIPPTPLNVLVVTDELRRAHPAQVRAYCDAFYKAQATFKEDPNVVEAAYSKWGYTSAVTAKVIESTMPFEATSGEITPEQLANIADATNLTIEGADVTQKDVQAHYENCSNIS